MNERKRSVGHEVKKLSHIIGRKIEANMRANGIDTATYMQGRIMGYLKRNSDREVYQRDIERFFNVSRSTVTNILQLMEKKGYIIRESSQLDARVKKLTLTPFGESEDARILKCLMETDDVLVSNISPEKLETFYDVVQQISRNCER